MHYVRKKKKKIPIGVIRPKIRVKNEISRFFSSGFWVDRAIGVGSFGSEPGFEQLLITAAQSIFQIEKSHSASL